LNVCDFILFPSQQHIAVTIRQLGKRLLTTTSEQRFFQRLLIYWGTRCFTFGLAHFQSKKGEKFLLQNNRRRRNNSMNSTENIVRPHTAVCLLSVGKRRRAAAWLPRC